MGKVESKETRSRIMASIKSSNTQIERKIGNILTTITADFEIQPLDIFGKPDFIIRKLKIAIFCDGDFWHGYDMENNPRHDFKNNRDFWLNKIKYNRLRDEKVNVRLRSEGWKVIRFWEHDIEKNPDQCGKTIQKAIKGFN